MAGKHRRAMITTVSVPIGKGLAREDDSSRASPFTSPSFFQVSLKSLALQEDSRRPFPPEKKRSKKILLRFFLLLVKPLPQIRIGAFRKNKVDNVLLGHDILSQIIIQRMQQINEIRGTNVADTVKKPFHFQSAHLFLRRRFRLINDNLAPAFRRRVPHIHIGHQIPRSSILFRSF